MRAPIFELQLIPREITLFEAVQFALLLDMAGRVEVPGGWMALQEGVIVGAFASPHHTRWKALERLWLLRMEGAARFYREDPVENQNLTVREMDLLEFQARSDEFWALLKESGLSLTTVLVPEGSPSGTSTPLARRVWAVLNEGSTSLQTLLDALDASDLEILKCVMGLLDRGVCRIHGGDSTTRRAVWTVVLFFQNLANLRAFFDRLGLGDFLVRRGRHTYTAYLHHPEGRVNLYGVCCTGDTVLHLRPLLARSDVVINLTGTPIPREALGMLPPGVPVVEGLQSHPHPVLEILRQAV